MAGSSHQPSLFEEILSDDYEERALELMVQMQEQISSAKPRRVTIDKDRFTGHLRLEKDYFAPNLVYPSEIFRRRFRMGRHVFNRIVDSLTNVDRYFQQREDCSRRRGLSPLQKCTAAMRMLAYGSSADAIDDYVRIGETTAIECLEKFTEDVITIFGDEYLRRPNVNDVLRLLQIGERRGFPGMMGSIDCMHWQWKNCPKAWKGMFMGGHRGVATIILEAVASSDLWIWHAFFGVAGSNNDINVLDRSPVFDDVLQGRAPMINYTLNDNNYDMGYYLADDIYPEWATFVKTVPDRKETRESYLQGCKKDNGRTLNGHSGFYSLALR